MYFKYDLKIGFCKDWYKFFVLIGVVLISCIVLYFYDNANALKLGSFDYLAYLTKAEKPYHPELNERFRFPFTWFILHLYLAWLIGKYPFSELYDNHGASVLILGGSRCKWYGSKLLWACITVLTYYLIIIVTVLMFCTICQIPITWTLSEIHDPQILTCAKQTPLKTLLPVFLLYILMTSVFPLILFLPFFLIHLHLKL